MNISKQIPSYVKDIIVLSWLNRETLESSYISGCIVDGDYAGTVEMAVKQAEHLHMLNNTPNIMVVVGENKTHKQRYSGSNGQFEWKKQDSSQLILCNFTIWVNGDYSSDWNRAEAGV